MKTVTINNKQLPAVEYRGQRIVTFAMVDDVHQRPEGTASAAYLRNKEHFIEGIDTYLIEYSENNVLRGFGIEVPFRGLRVLTETGYLMLTKPFNDPLSWQVQRELVNSYFRPREPLSEMEMIAAMSADAVRQQKRLSCVEQKVESVAETVANIKRGSIPPGWIGYSELNARLGMTPLKCKTLAKAFDVPVDTHSFMTPDGQVGHRGIVKHEPFMAALHQMMSEAECRGSRWTHPKMGLFQILKWSA